MTTWKFEWITDWETIWSDDFTKKWRAWLDQSWSGHVFFHPALVRAWVETYMPLWNISPLFLTASHGDVTVFLPLILWQKNWKNAFLREIIPVGYSDFDYHDPIIVGKKEVYEQNNFWSTLSEELNLLGMSYDTINITGIRAKCSGTGPNWHEDEKCPYCDISGFSTPEEFLRKLKKKLRGELRRRIRRLAEKGCISYHVYSRSDLDAALRALPRFLKAHIQRWPNAYKAPHFHENLLRFGLSEGVIHFSELRIDKESISWRLCFVDQVRFYSYMPSYDSKFAKFAPSKIHLLKCIEAAIGLGLTTYDNLRGEEAYKLSWTNEVEKLSNFVLRKNNFSSNFKFFMAEKIKPLISSPNP